MAKLNRLTIDYRMYLAGGIPINDNGTIRDSVFFSFIKDEWVEVKRGYFGGL